MKFFIEDFLKKYLNYSLHLITFIISQTFHLRKIKVTFKFDILKLTSVSKTALGYSNLKVLHRNVLVNEHSDCQIFKSFRRCVAIEEKNHTLLKIK